MTSDIDLMATMADKAKIVFGLCDYEGKGFITKRDMRRLQDELPLSLEQLEDVFDNLDGERKGYLTLQKFVDGFGQFVGLSPSSQESFEFLSNNTAFDASDIPSESIKSLIENFDASNRHEDIVAIKSLWLRLNREQPDVLLNFEDVVTRIVSMLENKQMDHKALQASIKNSKSVHDKEIAMLYAEMEAQINEEKKKICLEEMEKEKILRQKLEFELLEKERRLDELAIQQKEMEMKMTKMQSKAINIQEKNSMLIEEKKLMEKEYHDSINSLEETQAKINKIQTNKINNKMCQRQISLEISEWIALEKENLLKQIQNLECKNKQLMDNCDEYVEKLHSLKNYDTHSKKEISLNSLRKFSVDDLIPKDIEIVSSSSEDEDVKSNGVHIKSGRVYKVVFVGDSGVGKTTFIHRVCSKSFNSSLSSTIGIDFQLCNVRVDNQIIVLQLWDTAGQERYRSFSKQYFRRADGIIAMYDITDIESFLHIREWMEDIRDAAESNTVLMLFGTKHDSVQRENVTSFIYPGEARKLAYEYGASFFETSAKTGHNIEESLLYLARVLRDREDENISKSLMVLNEKANTRKPCCN